MINIISAGIEQADIIADLAIKTFYETYAAFNTKADMELYTRQHYSNAKIGAEMMQPDVQYFIVYLDDKVAGFAKLRNIEQPEFLQHTRNIEIERIYVLQQFQKMKLGKALIKHCLEVAKEKGFEVIWLGVWQQNKEAINFYEKNGFEKFGTHSFLLGEDLQTDWLMKMKL